MIVLDTNVLSEPIRPNPDPLVTTWLASEQRTLYITAVSVGELLAGVHNLSTGKRRTGLLEAIESVLAAFADQVLPYGESAARTYAAMQASRRAEGAPLSVEDGMIAAICRTHGTLLATRNTKDFAGLGISLVNPWNAPGDLSASQVTRDALAAHLGVGAEGPRPIPFAALGASGTRHTARDAESILEREWGDARRR